MCKAKGAAGISGAGLTAVMSASVEKGLIVKNKLNFTGSNPHGYKAEIRNSGDPYENGFSVFTWRDVNGVHAWREKHGLPWGDAFKIAQAWLAIVPID